MRNTQNVSATLEISSSLAAPAVRTLCVVAYPDPVDANDYDVLPVVAVESRFVQRYARAARFERDHIMHFAAHEEFLHDGCFCHGRELEYHAIVVDDECGELAPADDLYGMMVGGCDFRIVPAPWPEAEDGERLKKIVESMEARMQGRRPIQGSPGVPSQEQPSPAQGKAPLNPHLTYIAKLVQPDKDPERFDSDDQLAKEVFPRLENELVKLEWAMHKIGECYSLMRDLKPSSKERLFDGDAAALFERIEAIENDESFPRMWKV